MIIYNLPIKWVLKNNRKRTKGRKFQYIKLANGKTKCIKHMR